MRLTLLHTNDLHGRIQQLPRIVTLAKQIRREVEAAGSTCVLWDAGDAEDTTLFESSLTKGAAVMAILRACGYTQETLGNASPIRYGPQVIAGLAAAFGKPLLGANLNDPATGRLFEGLAPYAIETVGGLGVGVIGLTPSVPTYSVFHVTLGDAFELLPGLVRAVRDRGAEIVVVLSHLGSKVDIQIAERVPGIDVIIGGHDHKEIAPPLVVNGTIIQQAGDYGRKLGRLDLEIDEATGRVMAHQGELIEVKEETPGDPEAQAQIDALRAEVRAMSLRVIGELQAPLELAFDRECAAGNLLADVLRARVPGAEVAFVMAGHWQTGLEAGPLTLNALVTAIRSTANPARVELTGAQIAEFLRRAFDPEQAARKLHPLRGVPPGLPHVAGMTFRFDPVTHEVMDARVAGEPLLPHRAYVVAATDLELSEILNYLVVPDDQVQYELPTIIPEVMEAYIAAHTPLSPPGMGRYVTQREQDQ